VFRRGKHIIIILGVDPGTGGGQIQKRSCLALEAQEGRGDRLNLTR